jgi:5'-methylthioadenosine phosphorylase
MEGLTDVREVRPPTPFGQPSDAIVVGRLEGIPVAFLPRHGRGHRLNPSEVPVRANIYALKLLGVERVVSVSAVGSLKEEVRPLDLVVPDQLVDRTRGRASTFFEGGIVAHVSMADPFCSALSEALCEAARSTVAESDAEERPQVHRGGTYVVMEGPAFSTRAESALYRSWGASIIGMTAQPEARLAREAEMCYATLACVTDYDVWHPGYAEVSVETVVANLQRNVALARAVVHRLVPMLSMERECPCATALRNSIITAPERVPAEARERLKVIIGRYLG